MKTLKDYNLENKKVLVRCDFNVPLSSDGLVLDDFRIKKTVPTIEYLMARKAKIILISHLDDPGGRIAPNLKMAPVKKKLSECLNKNVRMSRDCIGDEVVKDVRMLKPGEVLLLENLRFHPEEEAGSMEFAKKLSELGEVYINDAFGCCHRKHASIVGVPQLLPSAAGLLLEKEIEVLSAIIENPKKPLVVIIGGEKIETKSKLIDRISEIADCVMLGGLMQKEMEEKQMTLKNRDKITMTVDELYGGLDIGPKTIDLFCEKISGAKTIFWNGPLGRIEEDKYQVGSREIAQAIVRSDAYSVVGGGETMEFLNEIGLADDFSHASTGGGAMLVYLSGDDLPGIEALK